MSETGEPRRRRRRRGHSGRSAARAKPLTKVCLTALGLALGAAIVIQTGLQTGWLAPTPADEVDAGWAAFSAPPPERDPAKAERLARAALLRQPLQARAASLIAVVKEQAGDAKATARLMAAAANLSRRDDVADYWLFEDDLKGGRFDAAALHADALLRREAVSVEQYLYPRMVTAFANPAFASALASRLVKEPPWRRHFLEFANANLRNPRAAFVIYAAIQKAGGRLTPDELAPYYRRLLAAGDYDQAYLSWVLFLPQDTVAKLTNVYDGDFQGWPETPPFGWNFTGGVIGSIESSEAYGRDGMALRVDYDAVTTPSMPSQILLLAPARYRLTGLALTATPQSPGRVAWSIACDKGATLLPPLPVADTKGAWRKFSADFTVPENCRGQVLALSPIPSGERSTVEVWYDQIAISRIDAAG